MNNIEKQISTDCSFSLVKSGQLIIDTVPTSEGELSSILEINNYIRNELITYLDNIVFTKIHFQYKNLTIEDEIVNYSIYSSFNLPVRITFRNYGELDIQPTYASNGNIYWAFNIEPLEELPSYGYHIVDIRDVSAKLKLEKLLGCTVSLLTVDENSKKYVESDKAKTCEHPFVIIHRSKNKYSTVVETEDDCNGLCGFKTYEEAQSKVDALTLEESENNRKDRLPVVIATELRLYPTCTSVYLPFIFKNEYDAYRFLINKMHIGTFSRKITFNVDFTDTLYFDDKIGKGTYRLFKRQFSDWDGKVSA